MGYPSACRSCFGTPCSGPSIDSVLVFAALIRDSIASPATAVYGFARYCPEVERPFLTACASKGALVNMRIMIAVFCIAIFGFSGAAMAEGEHVAFVKNMTGSIKVIRDKSEIISAAGTKLMRMDVVVSGPHSSAGIVFRDGTRLTVGASSEIEISRYLFRPEEARYDFSLYLRKGSAIYSSGKIGKLAPESVNLNTPRATVGVRGTRFIIKAD